MYQTDLTETEWQYITKVLNLQERKRKYDLRSRFFHLEPVLILFNHNFTADTLTYPGSSCRVRL